jgi:hypothetical protein
MLTGYSNIISVTTDCFTGLLDLYPNAAVAYSVRKLRAAYSGSAIRVRRSSDNAEQDIGFTSGGDLDETALTSFVGANNGFVTTWYDQSGNANNLRQTTASTQPQIVAGGIVYKINTKPYLYFLGQSQLDFNVGLNLQSVNSSLFLVNKRLNNTTSNDAVLEGGGAYIYLNYSAILAYGSNIFSPNPNNPLIYNLFTATNNIGNNLFIHSNNVNIATTNPATGSGVTATSMMTRIYGQNEYLFTEMIIYAIDQNSVRNDINTNINTYYGIY